MSHILRRAIAHAQSRAARTRVQGIPNIIDGMLRAVEGRVRKTQIYASPASHSICLANAFYRNSMMLRGVRDFRTIQTTYAHALSKPRPPLIPLARCQGVSLSTFARRYQVCHVNALAQMLAGEPDEDVVRASFPTLTLGDIRRILGR